MICLPVPMKRRNCGECEYAELHDGGVYCPLLREPIFDEYYAEECELYEPQVPLALTRNG